MKELARRFIVLDVLYCKDITPFFHFVVFFLVCYFQKNEKKHKKNTITTNKITTKLFSIINVHYQPSPLTNEEEDTTLFTIPRKVLLKLKKVWLCIENLPTKRKLSPH